MTELNFSLTNYTDSVAQVANWMGSRPQNNVVSFDGMFANGKAVLIELDPGLYIRAWDFSVKENTAFHMEAAPQGSPLYFTINYLLTPEAYRINAGGSGKEYTYEIRSNILFSSNQSHFAYYVKKQTNALSLDICFSEEWLRQQFPEDKKQIETLLSLQVPGINCFLEPFTMKDYALCKELSSCIFKGEWNHISVKAMVFQLLDDFMKPVFEGIIEKQVNPFNQQQLRIHEVAKLIETLLTDKLPHLDDIAAKFSMSTSTLKRHFKAAFGKNVYEYYLQKKMKLAEHLLRQEKLSVTEVAYKLGYEKVSSFSHVFKEHFGTTPKDFPKD